MKENNKVEKRQIG